ILNDISFAKVLTKKNKLDKVIDLWYFVRHSKNR
ncbi:YydF family exported signaling peptide, partial [Streptococcus agalactiae]